MYYLRKEPYREVFDIPKTDGSMIHHDSMTEDRALYKATDMSRFYRQDYPASPKGMKLYQVKRLSTILQQRQNLFDYCGEWFDVYDENGKVDISTSEVII